MRDTERVYLTERNGIRKQQSDKMESNTELHQLMRCPLSLHKFQIYPAVTAAEACNSHHEPVAITPVSLFILTKHDLWY